MRSVVGAEVGAEVGGTGALVGAVFGLAACAVCCTRRCTSASTVCCVAADEPLVFDPDPSKPPTSHANTLNAIAAMTNPVFQFICFI
jgi:hypothetical protein